MAEPLREVTVPEAKPAFEWVGGRAIQKVSPKRRHALMQTAIASAMREWARGRGDVGTEWRFRVSPPGEIRRPLVPDVAFLSSQRKSGLKGEDLEAPPLAPDIAVEILSPDDKKSIVDEKRRVYLASGVNLLIHVDPQRKRVEAYHADGTHEIVDTAIPYSAPEFPELVLPFGEFFEELDRG